MNKLGITCILILVSSITSAGDDCAAFYNRRSVTQPVAIVASKNSFEIKDIVKNNAGHIVSAHVRLSREITSGESALKISEVLRQLDATARLSGKVDIKITSNVILKGEGEFIGLELDVTSKKSKLTIHLEQTIAEIKNEQSWVSLLTETNSTVGIEVNLSGEIKKMGPRAKQTEQKCKN